MTQEEIAKVKAMSREQRRRHFKPLFMANKLTFKQYEGIINIEAHLPQMAITSPVEEDTSKPKDSRFSENVEETRRIRKFDDEDAVAELARQFGGYVVSSTPTGEQGELVKEDNKKERQIYKDMMSG